MEEIDKIKLRKYYTNLLIKQYHGKPKATATIETEVDPFIEIARKLKEIVKSFDIRTSTGEMIDLIGRLFGISRNINNDYIISDDEDYRFLIKLKLINEIQLKSIKSINEAIASSFNGDIMVFNHYDMTMTYWIRSLSNEMKAILTKYPDLLPSPSGVGIRIVYGVIRFFGVIPDGDANYNSPGRAGVVSDSATQQGELLEDGDNIND